MKQNKLAKRIFIVLFTVAFVFLGSANLIFAQCGSYFKTTYRAINKNISSSFPNISLDDWTGDGKSDFWNLRRNPTTLMVEIVISPSKPTGYWDFENPIVFTTNESNLGFEFTVMDFNSDGKKDLLFGGNEYQFLRNNGNGTMTKTPVFSDNGFVSGNIGFADVNGDQLLDWIYASFVNGNYEFKYQLQNPNGSFGTITTFHTTPFSSNKRLGDFNGDGKIDVIYSTFTNNQNIYVLLKNMGGGNFQAGTQVATDLYVFSTPISVNPVRDFNNDGKADVLSRTAIFYGQSDGTFIRQQLSNNADSKYPVELNGDNNLDALEIGSNYYATYLNNGTGGFSRTEFPSTFGQFFSNKFEDFNADGKADLFETNPTNPSNYNIFGERVISIKENICQSFGETKQPDFDGNRLADVVMWNPTTGNWSSKNANWLSADINPKVFNWGLGSLGDVPAIGDFDGDGKTDYSVYRNSTGYWYILNSSNSVWQVIKFGISGDIPIPNDFNGGGKTDIAVFRPSDGNWYIWLTETQQFQAVHFGANGDKPVPADYDGDSKTDIAVYRPTEGRWYYLKSSDGNFVVVNWGIATDKPIPGDYDGDGRADLTINRNGVIWLLRSSDNTANAITWGEENDVFMPATRNSVTADLFRFNSSNNLWYSFDNRDIAGFRIGTSQDIPVYFGLPNN